MKLRIGSGTIITVLLALAIGGYGVYRQRRTAAQPPVVERSIQRTTPRGVAPAPEFLLRHQADLALTDSQRQRIRAIAQAYRTDIAPYQQRMKTASASYDTQMDRANGKGRLNMQEIQTAGGAVRQVSGVMAATRQAYWQKARAVLSAQQQAKTDTLASRATVQDLQ